MDHESVRLGGSQHVVARMAACLADTYDVEIIHGGRGYTVAELGPAFDIDLRGVGERVTNEALSTFSVPGSRSTLSRLITGFRWERTLTQRYDLFIYSGHRTPPFCPRGRGIVYCHFPFDNCPSVQRKEDVRWTERGLLCRSLRHGVYEWVWHRRMTGYPVILANSYFSARWIERCWGRRAEVVYPPVALPTAGPDKSDLIVSLGRFISTDRKNLREQIRVFPEFLKRCDGNWSLCLVGFCSESKKDLDFLAELRESARELPVRFLVNAERDEIFSMLREAKLFWHTTGLASSGCHTAPRFQEHFGMATVEAMGVGCVPIVPDAGGQPEIVRHGESGFLCSDLEDLVEFSVAVARDEALRDRVARQAKRRSLDFAPHLFEKRIRKSVSRALAAASKKDRE